MMQHRLYLILPALSLLLVTAAGTGAERSPTADEMAFFEKKIRPVLATRCYSCHSAKSKKPKGALLLDTKEALRAGGESGRAIVPGQPKKSLLIQALYHSEKGLRMPPSEKLSDSIIADFEQWVRMGAPDPRTGGVPIVRTEIDLAKGRQFWSFQPPRRRAPPTVRDTRWPRADSDRFLLAGLEARGLQPVADADHYTLLRRVYFDLIGLPPTPEEVEAFAKNPSPQAFEAIVDRLLASPQFGERWGRHWLDVARYAETSGRQNNFSYPYAWRYRDYVIAALNSDKPFDRFVREQVAGDLLQSSDPRQRAEQQVATGFLALGAKPHGERNALQFQMDVIDEQIDSLSQAFLGLSAACARCHDHKFDPIPQRDYYALAGILRSTETCYGTIRVIQCLYPSPLLEFTRESGVRPGLEPLNAEVRKDLERQVAEIRERREKQTKAGLSITGQEFNRLAIAEGRLANHNADGTPKLLAMGARERTTPVDSPLYNRGEIDKPGDTVPRGLLQVLTRQPVAMPTSHSGRLELAAWLASPQNPLTARVFVNRVWLHLFGRGLVPTPDNFGATGMRPSNQDLLDDLAVSFMEDRWSVKRLIRRLVLSHAYQLSSRHDAANFKADPDNVLVWRMTSQRLEAEALRDALLSVSGQLELTPPAASPVARSGEGPSTLLMRQLPQLDSRDFHRAVYLPVLRDNVLESLALFDFADPNQVVGERVATNVPAQGLFLLNSPFVQARAEAAADRLLKSREADRVQRAYLTFFGRPPTTRDRAATEQFLKDYPRILAQDGIAVGQRPRATWAALCQALMASADFLYRN
jgi:cytochrome c553